jgi:hypothetical protein
MLAALLMIGPSAIEAECRPSKSEGSLPLTGTFVNIARHEWTA